MGKKSKQRKKGKQFPLATVMYYGPDDETATKVAVGIIRREGEGPAALQRWYGTGVRSDPDIQQQISAFMEHHGVRSVIVSEGIFGCPHEEGMDYPEGEECPYCPFWKGKSRDPGRIRLVTAPGKVGRGRTLIVRVGIAMYSREQWQRLLEVAADRDDLEASWEEWRAVQRENIIRLRGEGFEVHEVPVDVDALEEYCRRRGKANDSATRAEYVVEQLQLRFEGR